VVILNVPSTSDEFFKGQRENESPQIGNKSAVNVIFGLVTKQLKS